MSDAMVTRLPELIGLAAEPSSEKRRTLLRELTDHFFGSVEQTVTERALYGDVLAALAAEMETAVRAELATRFADSPRAPGVLIRRLSQDVAEVAAAIAARDLKDSSRAASPLHEAADAAIIDTSEMSIDQVVTQILKMLEHP
jgi:uncharacterized protein (DUF2336 family)